MRAHIEICKRIVFRVIERKDRQNDYVNYHTDFYHSYRKLKSRTGSSGGTDFLIGASIKCTVYSQIYR